MFPQWGATAYGAADPSWSTGLDKIRSQTGARWVEMTINLYQQSIDSLHILATPRLTPRASNVAAGIALARRRGFHVVVAPLITVVRSASGIAARGRASSRSAAALTLAHGFARTGQPSAHTYEPPPRAVPTKSASGPSTTPWRPPLRPCGRTCCARRTMSSEDLSCTRPISHRWAGRSGRGRETACSTSGFRSGSAWAEGRSTGRSEW